MIELSTIESKLIGISFLDAENRTRLQRLWVEAFQPLEAFWIDADPSDSEDVIIEKICAAIRNSKTEDIHNCSCVVSVFMDYSALSDEPFQTTLSGISAALQTNLFCTIPIEMQFVTVGTNPVPRGNASNARANIYALSKRNAENAQLPKKICLLGRNRITQAEDDPSWVSAIFYLDLLRRTNPSVILPAVGPSGNDDICFMRFAEYDRITYRRLESQVIQLQKKLGNSGAVEIVRALCDTLNEIDKKAHTQFEIDEIHQPIHPDLDVKGFWKKFLAKKGNNEAFNIAQRSTKSALSETGKALYEDVRQFFLGHLVPDAQGAFWKLIDRLDVGLDLLHDKRKMTDILGPEIQPYVCPPLPSFSYNENGYDGEIKNYLISMLHYAIRQSRADYQRELIKVFEAVTSEEIEKKKEIISRKLRDNSVELSKLPNEKQFIASVSGDGKYLNKCFFPIRPGGVTKKLVIDFNEQDAVSHDQEVGQNATVLLISDMQMMYLNASLPKGLQMLSFDCDDERLSDLIKEG